MFILNSNIFNLNLLYVFSQKSIYKVLSTNNKKTFRSIVESKAKNIYNYNEEFSYVDIMELRTMCIIMNSCFKVGSYLQEYNNKMMQEITNYEFNDYLNYNIAFHLLYYSRETLLFSYLEMPPLIPIMLILFIILIIPSLCFYKTKITKWMSYIL